MNQIVVVKIGTKSIVTPDGNIREDLLQNIAKNTQRLIAHGYKVIIVTSGAIACGKITAQQGLSHQAYAGIGQASLMSCWQKAFTTFKMVTAQVLYVNNNLRNKNQRESSTKVLDELLINGIIPIVNENDLVTDEETKDLEGFGDNDQLASLIAQIKKAKFLFFLTTVDGVMNENNILIPLLLAGEEKVEKSLQLWPGDSSGGMRSKVKSAKDFVKKVKDSCAIIANYDEVDIMFRRIIGNGRIGTEIY